MEPSVTIEQNVDRYNAFKLASIYPTNFVSPPTQHSIALFD